MANKILYVCQEITPYLPETEASGLCRALTQAMQERGNEIRTFMPRYGCINERRHQLHEVIRLSGMNLIIDDNDHQLIIKVASIPAARVQIYFIDNDGFPGELDKGFAAKIAGEGVKDKNLAILDVPSYENLCRFVMEYADGVVAASPDVDPKVLDMARASGKPMLEYQSPEAEDFFDNYNRFYEAIQ